MALTISEARYQKIKQAVIDRQATRQAEAILQESQQTPPQEFTTVEDFMAYLDTLVE